MRVRSDTLSGLAVQGFGSRLKASEMQQQLIESEKGLTGALDKQRQADAALGAALQRAEATHREGLRALGEGRTSGDVEFRRLLRL